MPRLNIQILGLIEIDTPPVRVVRSDTQACGLWEDLVRLGIDPALDDVAHDLSSDASLPRWELGDAVALRTSPPRLAADLPRLARELDADVNRLVAMMRVRS